MRLQRQGDADDCWLATIAMLSDVPLDVVRRRIDYVAWAKALAVYDYKSKQYR